MEPGTLFQEIGSSKWQDLFQFECNATKEHFRSTLLKWKSSAESLEQFQATLRKYQRIPESEGLSDVFQECKELEEQISSFQETPKTWEAEGKSQIVFTSEYAKPLNEVPYLLPATALFKIYVFPFFAVLLPLLSWILPYVIIRIFFKIHMPFDTYLDMMMKMWLGGKHWAELDMWGQARVVFQSTWTLFGLFQGIYQPIQQALHTKTLDEEIVKQGLRLQTFLTLAKRLFKTVESYTGIPIKCYGLEDIPMDEARQTYAYVRDHPNDIKWVWYTVADVEMKWKLAICPAVCFVTYKRGKTPSVLIQDFYDPTIDTSAPVVSSCSFANKHHAILTGPNKGGKSSSLRAILLNVWLAQTVGLAFAEKMELTPFSWIRSGLRLGDIPGVESLFERELAFASKTLRYARQPKRGLGLVLYDECFHSTNPPDGEKTARLFLQTLWRSQSTLSIVSTHVFSLVDEAPESVQRLCVPAEERPGGLHYTFELTPGVCKVSSVEELYAKHKFPCHQVRTNKVGNLSALNRIQDERTQ